MALIVLLTINGTLCTVDDIHDHSTKATPVHPEHSGDAATPSTAAAHPHAVKREAALENKEGEEQPFFPEVGPGEEVDDLKTAESLFWWKYWGKDKFYDRYPINYPLMYQRPPFPYYYYNKRW